MPHTPSPLDVNKRPRGRRGAILPIVAGATIALLGATAWVVDISIALQSRTHQQAAADAGALAGAHHLLPPADPDAAKAAAVSWALRNKPDATVTVNDVILWDHPSGRPALTVQWTQPVETVFARIFGQNEMQVGVAASAVLGGITKMPRNFIPFGIPAYQDDEDRWYVLSSPTAGDYRLMTADPAEGGPTQIILKMSDGNNNNGNFLALAVDGPGGATLRESIVNGVQTPVEVGDQVPTQTGGQIGPVQQGIKERLAMGPEYAEVVLPLFHRTEWETNSGHSHVTVLGFVVARLSSMNGNEIYATFMEKVLPGKAALEGNVGAGGYAPILIPTPQ